MLYLQNTERLMPSVIVCEKCGTELRNTTRCECGHRTTIQEDPEVIRKYLSKANKILKKNYRKRFGEIDIVAKYKECLIFVEVKTSKGESFGTPESWVNKKKQQQVGKIAALYLQEYDLTDIDFRFDVIGVYLNKPESERIVHIENAFWM